MNSPSPLHLVVLDDHPLIGKAIEYRLAEETDFIWAGAFTQRQQLLAFIQHHPVDILILDYMLNEQDLDGIALVKQLLRHFPALRILVYSAVEKPAIVQLLVKAGVLGFVGKSHTSEVLLAGLRQVARRELFLTADMLLELDRLNESAQEMHDYLPPREDGSVDKVMLRSLSPRELEVLRCYLDGLSITQIASKYARSRKTISGHKQTALRKLGLRSDRELFKYSEHFSHLN